MLVTVRAFPCFFYFASHSAHGPEGEPAAAVVDNRKLTDEEAGSETEPNAEKDPEHLHKGNHVLNFAGAKILGVAILEFGVALHSILIGLTLAVSDEFKVLFVVLVFHQMFEGLGLGSRLSTLNMPPRLWYVPYVGSAIYAITTPVGIAAGLGVRTTYNPNTPQNSITSGVLDSISAGILIYTGLVELLAHEFLFNQNMIGASNKKLAYALGCMLLGCGVMALLGRWA
jgi:zinc transporter 1/2/3